MKTILNFLKSKFRIEFSLSVVNILLKISTIYYWLLEVFAFLYFYSKGVSFSSKAVIVLMSFFIFSSNKIIYSKFGLTICILFLSLLLVIIAEHLKIVDGNFHFDSDNVAELTWKEIILGITWLLFVCGMYWRSIKKIK